MSDTWAPSGGETEADGLGDTGVAEDAAVQEQVEAIEGEAPEPEPSYDFLEISDDMRSKHVPVKVNGEEQPVPFDELINSYSRESVSTQRFQEAAEMRKQAEDALRLQQAFQVNPGLTVQFLAQQAGVSVQEYLGMTPQERQDATEATTDDSDEYVDPLEREVRTLREQIEETRKWREQELADREIASVANNLKSTYNLNDDQAKAVVAQTAQLGLGPQMVPIVYQAMAFQAQQQAQAQHTASAEAEKAKRAAAAQQAAQAVSTGSGATGVTQDAGEQTFSSLRESVEAAVSSVLGD